MYPYMYKLRKTDGATNSDKGYSTRNVAVDGVLPLV